ncbi:prefoldin subunit 3 [Trichophyton tonsurans CBS 112818]|uniref:Prefoldin subunit 3 n=1 Tax=Trichophyton tonsurans (strain CBS 112818) TaxID=647933 RepID=F2S5L1_TRIT1|nr:prefoldin subunit 3 [Trichophyton tonsurans CBS 112818]
MLPFPHIHSSRPLEQNRDRENKANTPYDRLESPWNPPPLPSSTMFSDYVTTRADVEPTLRSFQEMVSKYQFMEVNTQRRAQGLQQKIPDIRKTLETVRFLKSRREAGTNEPIQTTFDMNDTLYAHATVLPDDTDEVFLWLGANVMLAYPIDEAEQLLEEKLQAAESSFKNCEEDMEFLREQVTTLEVATARVYNWDVVQRRKEKAEGKEEE